MLNLKFIAVITFMGIFSAVTLGWMAQDPADDTWTLIQVPDGNKPLPDPVLTQIYNAI